MDNKCDESENSDSPVNLNPFSLNVPPTPSANIYTSLSNVNNHDDFNKIWAMNTLSPGTGPIGPIGPRVLPVGNPSHPYNIGTWSNVFKANLSVDPSVEDIRVVMPDSSRETITREDLIKYIGERKLIRENEVVRKMYERYQVAVKLARSDDNGDTRV